MLVTSLAKDQGNVKILGLAISNGLVSLAGCVFAQEERVFEISMGTGAMVIGLASVIIGTSIFKKISFEDNNGSSGWLDYLQSMRGSGNP